MEKAELLTQSSCELYCAAPNTGKDKKAYTLWFPVSTQLLSTNMAPASGTSTCKDKKKNRFKTLGLDNGYPSFEGGHSNSLAIVSLN